MYLGKHPVYKELIMVAVISMIATIVLSCKGDLPATDAISAKEFPTQVIDRMSFQQTSGGIVVLRVYAKKMERYTTAQEPYDFFPEGINVKAYTKDGALETEIRANSAKHKTAASNEVWEAYGNVIINNYVKGERMVTDTLYWNRLTKKIYTHCVVKLTSPDIFMQGVGMESDDMARNAVILKPFDSYAVVAKDSLEMPYIDSVNFIGPFRPKPKIANNPLPLK